MYLVMSALGAFWENPHLCFSREGGQGGWVHDNKVLLPHFVGYRCGTGSSLFASAEREAGEGEYMFYHGIAHFVRDPFLVASCNDKLLPALQDLLLCI